METNVNAYLNMDLYDEAEKVYSVTESLEMGSIDDGGYRVDKFQIPGLTTDMEISFASIGVVNFLILRADISLSIKLNDDANTAMVMAPIFPTVLSIAGISKIYVSNATDGATSLNVFSAQVSE